MAPSAVRHRHCQQVNPRTGQLHLCYSGSQILHKMVEAKPLTNVSSTSIKKFFWQNIICCYGVPRHITVGNTKYFDNAMFKDIYHQIGTKVAFALVYHPQTSGAVERGNDIIFEAIKKILEGEMKGKWVQVMPQAV
jgi:hypothetical protein